MTGIDPMALRRAFGGFPSGVVALAAVIDEEPQVLVASSFTVGVSLDPPLVAFAVRNVSFTWTLLRAATRLGVSVLGAEHAELCQRLASKDKSERFAGSPMQPRPSGALTVPGSLLRLECTVFNEFAAGDHQFVLLEIHDLVHDSAVEPLVFHESSYRRLSGAS